MGEVNLSGVAKRFGETVAVEALDLSIDDGEFVVLVGPSGCGKTTTLRMVAGLEEVSAGTIRLAGEDVTARRARERDIAMVFQNYALYPHMTVAENVGFALRMKGFSAADRAARIARAAELMGLSDLLARFPRQLSGGQRQRVAVCRAIVREPAVFLFDEPLSNLDAQLRVSARTEIRALQSELNTTSVYVTHDQVEAMTMADRIVVMHQGRVQQIADPVTLYEAPANTFVAAFIGSPAMNIVTATHDGEQLKVPGGALAAAPAASVGVRPEHLTPGEADGAFVLSGSVHLSETLGGETLVHLKPDDGAHVWQVRLPGHPRLTTGDALTVSAPLAHVHLFDEAGTRIGTAA
ncbi:MAG: sn-glycerol-3-phosphate ABC transporter ATP-binding protein UgpC [Pseudomonadota bacterium]